MNEVTKIDEVVVLEQLPVIKENLKNLEKYIIERTKPFASLVVSEDTKKEARKLKATLNKEKEYLEEQRKAIHKAINKPYDDFLVEFKKVISHYEMAKDNLGSQITEIENAQKIEIEEKIKEYFEEYKQSLAINYDFVCFENAKIKINLSDSLKKFKEQAKNFLDKVNSDLSTFNELEEKEEILQEYSRNLDAIKSIAIVKERKRLIEERRKQEEERQKRLEEQQKVAENVQKVVETIAPPTVEPIKPPTEEKTEEPILNTTFKVWGTKQQLIGLKRFLENGGYRYE